MSKERREISDADSNASRSDQVQTRPQHETYTIKVSQQRTEPIYRTAENQPGLQHHHTPVHNKAPPVKCFSLFMPVDDPQQAHIPLIITPLSPQFHQCQLPFFPQSGNNIVGRNMFQQLLRGICPATGICLYGSNGKQASKCQTFQMHGTYSSNP